MPQYERILITGPRAGSVRSCERGLAPLTIRLAGRTPLRNLVPHEEEESDLRPRGDYRRCQRLAAKFAELDLPIAAILARR
jgi:hypothetical protein